MFPRNPFKFKQSISNISIPYINLDQLHRLRHRWIDRSIVVLPASTLLQRAPCTRSPYPTVSSSKIKGFDWLYYVHWPIFPEKLLDSGESTIINAPLFSPQSQRAHRRVVAYRRRSQMAKSQREIITLIQKKRREDFLHVKRALFEVGSYKGKYLPTTEHKKRAGLYIRHHGLGKGFVEEFHDVGKWKWLHKIVDSPNFSQKLVSSAALPYKHTHTQVWSLKQKIIFFWDRSPNSIPFPDVCYH